MILHSIQFHPIEELTMDTLELKKRKDKLIRAINALENTAATLPVTPLGRDLKINTMQLRVAEAHQKYMECRHSIGWTKTNQYNEEIAEAMDAASIALYEFMLRVKDAA